MEQGRLYAYDNLKFFLIFSVVMGHLANGLIEGSDFFQGIFSFIYIYHMPLFLFVSGLFQKKYVKGSLNRHRVISLCMIGFLAKMVLFIWGRLVGRNPGFEMFGKDGIPWFMFVLAGYMVFMYFLRDVKPGVLLIFAIAMGCFAGYDKGLGDFLYLSRIFVYFPFYVFGYYLMPEQVLDMTRKKGVRVFAVVFTVGILILCFGYTEQIYWLRPLLTGRNPFPESLQMGGAFLRLRCYLLTFCMGASLISLTPRIRLPIVTVCGTRTLGVYFWHQCIIKSLIHYGISDRIFAWGMLGKIVLLLIPLAVTLFLSFKLFSWPLDYIMTEVFVEENGHSE